MSTRSVVKLHGITKRYDDITAVDDVDLAVREGEFFSLLGPSGCGKTTTLRVISGLETPTAGRVSLFDRDVTDVPARERRTNLVFQNLALFPHMTVEENILFALKHEGLTADEKAERVEQMLDVVDLPGAQDRQVTQLSGGQQQRVALARSLAKQPDVLLLDEPLGSLDRKLRQQMQFELRQIQEEIGTTFFYVTHNQEIAITMSDRMAVMRDGEIVQTGPPSELYERPENLFVANFIGDANFIDGSVTDRDGGLVFTATGGVELPTDERPTGDGVKLVIRPENVVLGDAAGASEFTFECEILERIYQGDTINYTVELEDGIRLDVRQKDASLSEGDSTVMGLDTTDYSVVAE